MDYDWKKNKLYLELAYPHAPPEDSFGKASTFHIEGNKRRKIRLIESNAKHRYLKKFTCKGILRQVFYLSEAPYEYDPHTPDPYTLYTCIQYNYSHRED